MSHDLFSHRDSLSALDESIPLSEKLRFVHGVLGERYSFIRRVAVATYDRSTDLVRTFAHSSGGEVPLSLYEAKLAECGSLREVAERRQPRVVRGLEIFAGSKHKHAAAIGERYTTSYTMPIMVDANLIGFVFFNGDDSGEFDAPVLHTLDLFGHLVSLVVINELRATHTLLATLKSAKEITNHRDGETGAHLDRMAQYSRIIAREIAVDHGLDDEFVEHVGLFAPLHDIGKIGVPDGILLKPGRLSADEKRVMQSHVQIGRQLVERLLENYELEHIPHVDLLRNIVSYHHEALDGSGYSTGLSGEAIPIEARIIAVADIFDALTSARPYKPAWSNEQALAELRRLAGTIVDEACVEALERCIDEVEEVQRRSGEDPIG